MQDRGDPVSKMAQKKQRDANGGKRVPPTKTQLADPAFYRVERLAKQAAKPNDGKWHHIKIRVSENQVTAQFDKQPPLTTKGTVLNVAKSRVVFLVGNSGDIRIDNVKAIDLLPITRQSRKTEKARARRCHAKAPGDPQHNAQKPRKMES